MSLKQVDFSKVLNDEQVYNHMMANYDQLGKDWINHQWRWMNAVYQAFKDHYKYMIIISLVEKTLQFYDQMNIKLSYEQFYSKNFLQIDKFSITELCEKLQLPKETVRRKVLELEKLGVLKRQKKQIIIDRRSFSFIKPERQMKYTAGYILKEFNPGVNASFDRNPNYWKAGHAHFDGVETTIIADSTARNQALLTGQVDCIDDVSAPTAGLLSRNPNIDVLGGGAILVDENENEIGSLFKLNNHEKILIFDALSKCYFDLV